MTTGTSQILRRATSYMAQHLAEPLTLAQIARASSVSARSVQLAFRRELGMTPMSWLRQQRLAAARDRLQAASAHSTTVTEVAASVGISHFGRFALDYRRHFGTVPSRTLAQSAIVTP